MPKKKKLINLKRFTRQELGHIHKLAKREWIKQNASFYMEKCFKEGDWVKFREAAHRPNDYRRAPHGSVKANPEGKCYIGRVRVAFVQKTGRIQRYHITYYGVKGKIEETPRGINQVVAASPQEIQAVSLMASVKGYDKLWYPAGSKIRAGGPRIGDSPVAPGILEF